MVKKRFIISCFVLYSGALLSSDQRNFSGVAYRSDQMNVHGVNQTNEIDVKLLLALQARLESVTKITMAKLQEFEQRLENIEKRAQQFQGKRVKFKGDA